MVGMTISKIITNIAHNKQDVDDLGDRLGKSEDSVLDAIAHSASVNISLQALLKDVVQDLESETQDHIERIDSKLLYFIYIYIYISVET